MAMWVYTTKQNSKAVKRFNIRSVSLVLLFLPANLHAADWLTDGGNSQRTGWQQDEKLLSPASVKDMKLLWKIKLDNVPRQMHALFPPLIINSLTTANGPKQVVIETGVSDNVYAI